MKRLLIPTVFTLAMVGGGVLIALAADTAKPDKAKDDKAAAGLTVAILDFTADDPANPNAGSDMAAALTAMLSGEAGFKLVERQSLLQTLHEHELNLTGMVNQEQAVKVDMLIAGEAFSEFAARIGNIVSCSARTEINMVSRKDGKVVLTDRVTTRAADLSEKIAGKKALQGGGLRHGDPHPPAFCRHAAGKEQVTSRGSTSGQRVPATTAIKEASPRKGLEIGAGDGRLVVVVAGTTDSWTTWRPCDALPFPLAADAV